MKENVKNIVVLGAGESGCGSALLAQKKNYRVFVSDFSEIASKYKNELKDAGIEYEEKGHNKQKIKAADLIIKSPGIPDKAPVIKWIKEQNIPIVSDIEFGSWFTKAKIIAITGANGKTTTTLLTHHIFKHAGIDVEMGGNIGVSLCRRLLEKDRACFILELSSFQLDYCTTFKPYIAILLNITPDHLDRYNYSMDAYAASKFRITMNQDANDYFVYTADDPVTMQHLNTIKTGAQKLAISQKDKVEQGAYTEDNNMIINIRNHNSITIDMNILSLVGAHNKYNSMAATIAASAFDIQDEIIRECLSNFQNVSHRLENVAKIQGKEFINDSKATNLNATWYALESMDKPVIWIVGGIDKGNNYDDIKPLVRDKVKAIVCLGVDNTKIIDAFKKDIELIFDTASMDEAVEIGYKLATADDVILLSPACASFDLFKNYEERGDAFKEAVRNL